MQIEAKLKKDQTRMEFAIRQVLELMKMSGLGSIEHPDQDGYYILIKSNKEKVKEVWKENKNDHN